MSLAHHLQALMALVVRMVEPAPPPRSPLEFRASIVITEGTDHVTDGGAPRRLGDHRHAPQEAATRWALRFRRFVVVAIPQDGKDTGIGVPLLMWALIERRRPAVYATTDRGLGAKLYRAKLREPLLKSGYGWALPDEGTGSEGGTPDDILFQTGARLYVQGAGASNGGGQAGITAWLVVITEADKIRAAQRRWIEDRNASYTDEARTVLVGTLDRVDGKGLRAEYDGSVKGRMHHPCPCCGFWQTWEWEQVEYDATSAETARASARIRCRGCKELLDEDQRQWSVERSVEVFDGQQIVEGKVVGTPNAGETGGLMYWALDSFRRSLPTICAQHREAVAERERTGDDTKLREFWLKELVRIPEDRVQTLSLRHAELAQRSAAAIYRAGQYPNAPAGCITIIAVDVQLRRLLWSAITWDPATWQWWLLGHGRLAICGDGEEPTRQQRHAGFDRIAAIAAGGFTRADGSIIRPPAGVIDTGDGATQADVLTWISRHPGWYPIKGDDDRPTGDAAPGTALLRLPGVLTVSRQAKAIPQYDLFVINVDAVKGHVLRALSAKPGDPGSGHLPRGEAADGELIKELCAERLEQTDDGPRWVQLYRHNHRLDTTVYCWAFAYYLHHLRTLKATTVDAQAEARRMAGG